MSDSLEKRLLHFPYEPSLVQWSSVFDQSPIGITFCDTDGRFMKMNRKFCEIMEYTEVELINKTYVDITHPDDIKSDTIMHKKCLDMEIPGYEIFKRYITKTGKVIWVRLTVWPIVEDNKVTHFICHIQSILNGNKLKLEKVADDVIVRDKLSFGDFIQDNFKSFLAIIIILISSFTGMGVAYWGAVNEVSIIKKEQSAQKELLFRLYEILSHKVIKE